MKYTRLTYALTVCFALLSAGCPPSTPKPRPGKDRLPLKGVTLRLAVAADPRDGGSHNATSRRMERTDRRGIGNR